MKQTTCTKLNELAEAYFTAVVRTDEFCEAGSFSVVADETKRAEVFAAMVEWVAGDDELDDNIDPAEVVTGWLNRYEEQHRTRLREQAKSVLNA